MSSTNITSWADASSDSDSDDSRPRIAPPPSNLPGSSSYAALQEELRHEEELATQLDNDHDFGGRGVEDLNGPPFTAFVGGMGRDEMGQKEFRALIEGYLVERNCVTETGDAVIVAGARLINDRNTGQSKGFGYVEFATPQELLAFLNLPNHQINGRNLKVDIASGEPRAPSQGGRGGSDRRRSVRGGRNDSGRGGGRNSDRYERQYSSDSYHHRNNSNRDDTPIDGSQFQGGRYSRSASNMSQGSISGGGMRRNGSGLMKRSDSATSTGSSSMVAPQQRPSLKLAPRTKPLVEENSTSTRSSIFGDAKPRDEAKFEEKKAAEAAAAAAAEAAEKEESGMMKTVTTSMSDLEVVQESNDNNADKEDGPKEKADEPNIKEEEKSTEEKQIESPSPIQNKTLNRKPSRGAGRGGDRPERNNSRRDGRKPGRGEGRGRGGGRSNDRSTGRNNGRESGKRPSVKSTANNGNSTKDGNAQPTSSLAAAAAMPVKPESKAPPKKANSFAAFLDDSDDE